MTQSQIGVSTGTDKFLHSNTRTIGGTALEEQLVIPGQAIDPTYNILVDDVAVSAANEHLIQIMADGTGYTRLLKLTAQPTENLPASIGHIKLALYRLSSAGTGGAALSDAPYESTDSYGGDMRSLPTSKGTEGQLLTTFYRGVDTGAQRGHAEPSNVVYEWLPGTKPIIFGTGATDGIALKIIDALASTSLIVQALVITTAYK